MDALTITNVKKHYGKVLVLTHISETNFTRLIPLSALCVLFITYLFSNGWKLRT
ncbi:MAG: hypothetical protein ABIJ21_00905 [Nanoarchaeota archaeon]